MSNSEYEKFLESSNLESEFVRDKQGRVKYISTFSKMTTPEQRAESTKKMEELFAKIEYEAENTDW